MLTLEVFVLSRQIGLLYLVISIHILEKEWEKFVKKFTGHVDTTRCLEITQKGFDTDTIRMDEEQIIPSNPRQLSK